MDPTRIVAEILKDYPLSPWGAHGLAHWARVMENGLKLAETTGANVEVVRLFALFHDSRREDDGDDYGHGKRGADFAEELRGRLFELPDREFELLYRACQFHTGGRGDPDVTVLTCWDADRLDLGRVGIVPNPLYLCTAAARRPAVIGWAHDRAVREHVPDILAGWGVPARSW
jgi:uncharacterized protein